MVIELNDELAVKSCPFRYKYKSIGNGHVGMEFALPNMNCVDNFIINVTKEFIEWLKLWFKTKYNIELMRNSTANIFWVKEN